MDTCRAWITPCRSGTIWAPSFPKGSSQRSMSSVVFWFVIVAILLAEGAIIVAALRMRVVSNPSRGVLGARPFEIFWTLLPLALVALMVFLSYDAHQTDRSTGAETSTIQAEV